jgi:hypothetical protein
MELLIMQFPPTFCHFTHLDSNAVLSTLFSNTLNLCSSLEFFYHRTKLQDPTFIGAIVLPTSQIRTDVMMVFDDKKLDCQTGKDTNGILFIRVLQTICQLASRILVSVFK